MVKFYTFLVINNSTSTLNKTEPTVDRVVKLALGTQQTTQNTHTQTPKSMSETSSNLVFRTQFQVKTISENRLWLQGNHQTSPFTKALCVKRRCLLSRFLNTAMDN